MRGNVLVELRLVVLSLVATIVLAPAVASADAAVIISGLSPDAVGHFDADQCRVCDTERDAGGLCDNSCVSCHDATRTTFAGDGTTTGCGQFDGDQSACNAAWQLVNGTPMACFFTGGICSICDSSSQKNSLCINTCFPCADAARTSFQGDSFFPADGCRNFDANQAGCATAWVLNGFSSVPLSCFFDSGSNECHACEIGERAAGQCTNTCAACEDPTFTQFSDAPAGGGCETLAGNESSCTSTWQYANGHVPAPCFFTAGTEVNQGGFLFIQDGFDRLGPLVTNGKKLAVCLGCNGTTALEGFNAGFDEATLPGLGWTRATITDPTEIGQFFTGGGPLAIADAGLIYIPSQEDDSSHQGISAAQIAALDANKTALGAFVANGGGLFALNQSRIEGGFEWLDAIVPGAQARNGSTCLQQLDLTIQGTTTFPHVDDPLLETFDQHTSGYFLGTFGALAVLANGQCRDVTCKDATKTTLLGMTLGFFDDICQLETDEATCNAAWQLSGAAIACAFDTNADQCQRCGRTSQDTELCANTCLACDDPSRTVFAGDAGTVNCEGISDPAVCETAWAIGREGLNVSCFFDEPAGFCRACETEDEITNECTNTCEPSPGARAVVLGPAFVVASPVATPSSTATATPTPTVTPVATETATPVATETATPVPTLTAVPTPTATATAGPVGPLPRVQCYEIDRERGDAILGVQIADAFGTRTADLRRATRLCTPADVNGSDAAAPVDARHLLGYEMRDSEPRFEKVHHVQITNELGTIDTDLRRPVLLMTPTRKSRSGDPGEPGALGIDHFQCYDLGGGRTRVADVTVADQFGSLQVDIKFPFRACVAASKNGEAIADPSAALLCYRVRPERRPRFSAGSEPIFVHDQFGAREITLTRPTELCLPSTIAAP